MAVMGGPPPGLLDDPAYVDELHAAANAATALASSRMMRMRSPDERRVERVSVRSSWKTLRAPVSFHRRMLAANVR
ncbi:MAG: hypothetical protein JF589_10130 [Gemmatimonadetes bacterium]|nr:hypothetical protein [Gemmatimonadota bacterium]